jgi:hypothetical protein
MKFGEAAPAGAGVGFVDLFGCGPCVKNNYSMSRKSKEIIRSGG